MDRLARVRRHAGDGPSAFLRAAYRAARRRVGASANAGRGKSRATATKPAGGSTTSTRARFKEQVQSGTSPEAAAAATVRELLRDGETTAAVSFSGELAARSQTATPGHLAAGIAAVNRRLPSLANAEFADVPFDVCCTHALAEYLQAMYQTDEAQTVEVLRRLLAEHPGLSSRKWFEVVRYAFVTGELELARQAYDRLVARATERPAEWADADTEIAWLEPWLTRDPEPTLPGPPDGQVPFAVIAYGQPGRVKASANIGDHIQTLASLGHLVRHQNVRFHGDADLVDFAGDMQGRVLADRRLDTPPADVALYTVDRDASNHQAIPEGTWTLAFGWYMHPLFGLRHDFPMHPNLRPIFVSFHCSKREMLTEQAVEYLRRNAPIGCRDWTTVDLLLSLDVPAFFSGCLTTTVDTVFPPAPRPAEPATVYVDVPEDRVPEDAPTAYHSDSLSRFNTFVMNMRDAVDLLDWYRTDHTKVATPRLHCYLPARSLGLEVDFQPSNRADVRFNGLIDIDDTAFDDIRTRMLARLEAVLTAILAGEPEAEVRRRWQEACAGDVELARQRHTAESPLPGPSLDIAASVQLARESAETTGPEPSDPVHVAIRVGPAEVARLPRTLRSLQENSSRPVKLWLLAWGCGSAERERVTSAFPDLSVTWLPCDAVSRDVATILLAELLPDVDRVTLLPPAAVALGDVAELAKWPLDGHPLAARTSVTASSGFGRFYRASRRLHPDAELAHDLFRRVHARHVFDFEPFDGDVLVADLAKMRADGFAERFLPYLEHFGMTALEVLTLYVGADRAVLPAAWAHVPDRERLASPRLVHWSGTTKPWSARFVAGKDLWQSLATAEER